jgi:regulator of protease activity HflC (stomatin/prohibitin superfamily)
VEPLIVVAVIIVLVLLILARSVRIVPQARAGIVERLGRYQRTLNAGLTILIPFVDRLKPLIDLREQVVSFPPQPVITSDNLVVSIDTVIYFQVTDPRSATYEIANYIQGVEQLTVTTLRNVVGSMDLERTLTSREEINTALRGVLDEATGKWGIRVNRVELKAIEPPVSIRDSMEKQMRADRDKRAAVLNAEGVKQSQILTAEGERQSNVLRAQGDKEAFALRAEGERQAAILRSQGEAQAIETVFASIHAGDPDPKLLSYQYLQMLPRIAEGNANKLWIVPSEVTRALDSVQSYLSGNSGSDSSGATTSGPNGPAGPRQVTGGTDGAGAPAHPAALGPVPLDSPVPPARHSELLDEAERIARQTEEEAAKVVRDAEPAAGPLPRDERPPSAG